MKTALFLFCIFIAYQLKAQVTSVAFNAPLAEFIVTGSPITTSGTISLGYNNQVDKTFFAGPISGSASAPVFRAIVSSDLPIASVSNEGIVNTTTQTFGGAKTFGSSVAIIGTSGNTFSVNTDAILYNASTDRIGINRASPSYMIDIQAQETTATYLAHRASDGDIAYLMDFEDNNLRLGMIDAAGNTTIKLRSNSISFIKNHLLVGDATSTDVHPQFKVMGSQEFSIDPKNMINYQTTVQNKTDAFGKSAAIGFGVDNSEGQIGAYISFIRSDNPSNGGLHLGVMNTGGTAIQELLVLESGHVILQQQTASRIAVLNGSKQLVSGNTGSGIMLNSDILSLDINGLTEEVAVDRNADYVAIYDASTGTIDKAKAVNLAMGITLQGVSNTINPADDANYYAGAIAQLTGTNADINRIYVPKSGTIKGAYIYFYNGVAGSNEYSTIYLKINTTILVNLGSVQHNTTTSVLSNNGLNTQVAQGDYIELKWDCPVWVSTNPEDVSFSFVVYIE